MAQALPTSAENGSDSPAAPRAARVPGSLAELLTVAWPLIISTGFVSMQFLIDRIFLTWYSTDAVAAAFASGMIHWTLISGAVGTAGYVNTFVSQYTGAGEPQRVGAALWQGIYFSLSAAVPIALCVPLAPWGFAWLAHDSAIRPQEIDFFSILCLGTLPLLIATTLACFYTGRGKTRVVMGVNITATLVTVVFDYLLIFGHAGFPAMGVRGAAVANVLSYCTSAALYLIALVRRPDRALYGLWIGRRWDGELLARLLRFGLPNGVQYFVDVICYTIFIQLVGKIGPVELKATALAFNLSTLTFMPLLGLGTAVMVLTGQRIGEGRPELAVRTTWYGFGLGLANVLLFGTLYVLVPDVFLQFYLWGSKPGDMESIAPHVKQLLVFVACYSAFDAMALIFSSTTRGAGDTLFAVTFTITAGIAFLVLPTWVVFSYSLGLRAAWLAVTAFIFVLGVGFLLRFLQGRWKQMRVIEPVPAGEAVQ